MHVIATAGHVDHGKSTLVKALTGVDPDRHAEEKRRGLTISLGYAWTHLGDNDQINADPVVAFVDVPGHERFLSTTLAGLGPVSAVMFVVAADEGWRRQSTEHLAAIDALGLSSGLLVITRSDLAAPAAALSEAREHLAKTSFANVPAVSVSAVTGAGLGMLRAALSSVVEALPTPVTTGRVRLWIDRSFTIRGAGTVVTGTLGAGQISVGDQLAKGSQTIGVRGLQSLGVDRLEVEAVARVAVNLRNTPVGEIRPGDTLTTPGAWPAVEVLDGRCLCPDPQNLATHLIAHLGTAATPVRLRALGVTMVRLTFGHALPIEPGDRIILRDPGRQEIVATVIVLDVDPPELSRRGSAGEREVALLQLESSNPSEILAKQLTRRGAARRDDLAKLGIPTLDTNSVVDLGSWLIAPEVWATWQQDLRDVVKARVSAKPLDPFPDIGAAGHLARIPNLQLTEAAAEAAGFISHNGRLYDPSNQTPDLGPAEQGVQHLERFLATNPFQAPTQSQLTAWGLGSRELAAAAHAGRILRLTANVVLLKDAVLQVHRILASLPQPFTASAARQALHTTRRVAIPLLEYLDQTGVTTRSGAGERVITSNVHSKDIQRQRGSQLDA